MRCRQVWKKLTHLTPKSSKILRKKFKTLFSVWFLKSRGKVMKKRSKPRIKIFLTQWSGLKKILQMRKSLKHCKLMKNSPNFQRQANETILCYSSVTASISGEWWASCRLKGSKRSTSKLCSVSTSLNNPQCRNVLRIDCYRHLRASRACSRKTQNTPKESNNLQLKLTERKPKRNARWSRYRPIQSLSGLCLQNLLVSFNKLTISA